MPNWDEDSPQLRVNLARLLEEIAQAAQRREKPTLDAARHWQTAFLQGLDAADARYVGAFRGEPGLENVQARVDANYGVASADVSESLQRFEAKLQTLVAELDAALPSGQEPDADQLAAIVDLCAWAHAEWVRIHPFANGNGRTARLWANSLALTAICPIASATQHKLWRGRRQSDAGRMGAHSGPVSPLAGRFFS